MTARAARRAIRGLLLLAALPALAQAHEAPSGLPCAIEARSGRLTFSCDLAPAFPPDLQRQLTNGLTNVIAVHVALVPEHGDAAAALYGREIDVLYDVWNESFGVTWTDSASPQARHLAFREYGPLFAFLADGRGIDLGPVSNVASGSWVVQTRVEVNPVSKELLERTREFIANPSAGSRVGGASRSVLGAMASYLLRDADPGADVHLFRSRPFTIREVVPR